MRLGLNYNLKAKDAESWAEGMANLHCRAASFPLDYHAEAAEIDSYVQAAKEHDILIAEVGAWSNPMAANAKERNLAMEKCVEQLKLADYIGAVCACNIAGSAGKVWDAYYPENMSPAFYEKTVDTIRTIIERAKPERAKYAVEPMPWMVPTSPDEYLQMIRDVGSPSLAVHLDMVNWMNSFYRLNDQKGFMDEVFEKLHGLIVSCHFKDVRLRKELTFQVQETPIGKGIFDIDYYVKKIDEENPELPLLIEHLSSKMQYTRSMKFCNTRYFGL